MYKLPPKSVQNEGDLNQTAGLLVVITGASGAGKDTIKDKVTNHPEFIALGIQNIITCTDRPRRVTGNPPESENAYHFVSPAKLDEMQNQGELAEPITKTGTSRKATPKFEVERLLTGEHLIWRIDPSRAADIAAGTYYPQYFPHQAELLQQNTLVICINASREVIEERRRRRDGANYNPQDYLQRDAEEAEHLKILAKKALVIDNPEEAVSETTRQVLIHIKAHHAKLKKQES